MWGLINGRYPMFWNVSKEIFNLIVWLSSHHQVVIESTMILNTGLMLKALNIISINYSFTPCFSFNWETNATYFSFASVWTLTINQSINQAGRSIQGKYQHCVTIALFALALIPAPFPSSHSMHPTSPCPIIQYYTFLRNIQLWIRWFPII